MTEIIRFSHALLALLMAFQNGCSTNLHDFCFPRSTNVIGQILHFSHHEMFMFLLPRQKYFSRHSTVWIVNNCPFDTKWFFNDLIWLWNETNQEGKNNCFSETLTKWKIKRDPFSFVIVSTVKFLPEMTPSSEKKIGCANLWNVTRVNFQISSLEFDKVKTIYPICFRDAPIGRVPCKILHFYNISVEHSAKTKTQRKSTQENSDLISRKVSLSSCSFLKGLNPHIAIIIAHWSTFSLKFGRNTIDWSPGRPKQWHIN